MSVSVMRGKRRLYSLMRERMLYFLLLTGKQDCKGDKYMKKSIYKPNELRALTNVKESNKIK